MRNYTFYWKNGNREIITEEKALQLLKGDSYKLRSQIGLDFYAKGECNTFIWDDQDQEWLLRED